MKLSPESRKKVMDTMRSFADERDDKPQVGIFWVNERTGTLYGVFMCDAEDGEGYAPDVKTYPRLHRDLWRQASRQLPREDRGAFDYTSYARGRVFYNPLRQVFSIMHGDWLEKQGQELREEILETFNLTGQDVRWVRDSHWDLGHGWTGDAIDPRLGD
jgi:hypothetical protein